MVLRSLALTLTLALGTKLHPAGAEPPFRPFAPAPRGPISFLLEPARALAAERLGGAMCRSIFLELPDFTGRPVARRLAEGQRSPSAHFARLRFVESREGPCAEDGAAAWTVAGEAQVRVCPGTFRTVARRDPREAAALLIHEALHTLGVAENAAKEPLTSFVRRRCGL